MKRNARPDKSFPQARKATARAALQEPSKHSCLRQDAHCAPRGDTRILQAQATARSARRARLATAQEPHQHLSAFSAPRDPLQRSQATLRATYARRERMKVVLAGQS